jgi:hypothetical protein
VRDLYLFNILITFIILILLAATKGAVPLTKGKKASLFLFWCGGGVDIFVRVWAGPTVGSYAGAALAIRYASARAARDFGNSAADRKIILIIWLVEPQGVSLIFTPRFWPALPRDLEIVELHTPSFLPPIAVGIWNCANFLITNSSRFKLARLSLVKMNSW